MCVRSRYGYGTMTQLRLTCTAHGVLWSTSGFGKGLDDQIRVSAVSLANTSLQMITTDTSSVTNSSSITLSNFNFDDHRATVTCEGHLPTIQQSVTISVGEFEISA